MKEKKNRYQYADGVKRVTAGAGGEAVLIIGSERTALIDCGMAYCGEVLIANIKRELGDRPLDYVILSHTHYDHIGGLPYLRREWPDLVSFGAAYGKKVLDKETALQQIMKLAEGAWERFCGKEYPPEIVMEGLRIDRIICENDVILLGEQTLHVYETPGHTTCSLTLLLEPAKVLIPSETTGVYLGQGRMISGMVKSCSETIESIEKCRNINAESIICPHYGQIPEADKESYWDIALASVNRVRSFIRQKIEEGASYEKILEEYTKEFYAASISEEQPREAFLLNAQHMIRNLVREIQESSKKSEA
jgi:glyoxylase-like metal-dependent hydrolase (beta-lactamase superfamily II)